MWAWHTEGMTDRRKYKSTTYQFSRGYSSCVTNRWQSHHPRTIWATAFLSNAYVDWILCIFCCITFIPIVTPAQIDPSPQIEDRPPKISWQNDYWVPLYHFQEDPLDVRFCAHHHMPTSPLARMSGATTGPTIQMNIVKHWINEISWWKLDEHEAKFTLAIMKG